MATDRHPEALITARQAHTMNPTGTTAGCAEACRASPLHTSRGDTTMSKTLRTRVLVVTTGLLLAAQATVAGHALAAPTVAPAITAVAAAAPATTAPSVVNAPGDDNGWW
ncbi:hypothetical protein [Streptomyces sp. NPDC088915]|uniref:hypothetical protein n=1 Tax=Streptomyces sp. NPDC088915 TaxID=3365912 RepID=UPI00382701BE